jgi:HNH endonuclease
MKIMDIDKIKEKFIDCIKVSDLYDYYKCWNWIGAKNNYGYGQFSIKINGTKLAHRIAWILFKDEPIGKLHVLHKCDNPSCVNANHLFLGTNQDNIKDKCSKNRQAKGLKPSNTFLTNEDISNIKLDRINKIKVVDIAKKYNCSNGHISNIINGRSCVKE